MADAADAYLEATATYKESKDARCLEILAYLLLEDQPKALELAEALSEDAPDFSRGVSLWIQAQPKGVALEQVLAAVDARLLEDAEVALSLAGLASENGDLETAECFARKAVGISPTWADALNSMATIILTREQETAKPSIDEGFVPESPERVREAEKALTTVISQTPATDSARSLPVAYFNRSVTRKLLRNSTGASDDLERAFQRDPSHPVILWAFAMNAESPEDCSRALAAIDNLPNAPGNDSRLQFARILLHVRRGTKEDLQTAAVSVQDAIGHLHEMMPPEMRQEFVRLGLHLLSATSRTAECPGLVSSVPPSAVPQSILSLLQGNAALLAGSAKEATKYAQRALETLDDDINWFDRRDLAELAEKCHLYAAALELWEQVLDGMLTSSDTNHYIRCALLAGEWKRVLETCDILRSSGNLRRSHLLAEAHVFANTREPSRALAILQNWLCANPDDHLVRLELSLLALRFHDRDSVTFDETRLPTLTEINHVEEGAALAYVLRRGPAPHRGVEIAYDLYRRFPESSVAHRTLIACVFDPSVEPIRLDSPVTVKNDTAVCICRKTERSNSRWIYIESGSVPALSRDEYGEAHELARALLGGRVGDSIGFRGHEYEILTIQSKILRRVHTLMETFEERFPGTGFLKRFNVPARLEPHHSAEEFLGEVYTELRKQSEHREQLESIYSVGQLPLTSFAKLTARPVFNAVRYFASAPSHIVRADSGDPRGLQSSLLSLARSSVLVLDATALASALILGILDILPDMGYKFIVPLAVLQEIQELSLDAGNNQEARLTIGVQNDRVFVHENTSSELVHEVESIERVVSFVKNHCEVLGGEASLDLLPEIRGELLGVLGPAATDALAIARMRKALLWTDDLGIRVLADSPDLAVSSVWTQAVMASSLHKGRINASDYNRCLCKLVLFRYSFVALSAADIAAVMHRAGWSHMSQLGVAATRLVAEVALLSARNCVIVGAALLHIWRDSPRRGLARDIIAAILSKIGREQAGPLITSVCSNPHPQFKSKSARSLKRMLRSWRGQDKEFRLGRMTKKGPIQ